MQIRQAARFRQALNDLLQAVMLAFAIGAAIGGSAMAMAADAQAFDRDSVDACEMLGDPDCRVVAVLRELEELRALVEVDGADSAPR